MLGVPNLAGAPAAVHQLLKTGVSRNVGRLLPQDVSGVGPEGMLFHVPKALSVRTHTLGGTLGLQALSDRGYMCQEKLDGVCFWGGKCNGLTFFYKDVTPQPCVLDRNEHGDKDRSRGAMSQWLLGVVAPGGSIGR